MGKDKWVAVALIVFILGGLIAAQVSLGDTMEEAKAEAATVATAPPVTSTAKPPPILGNSMVLNGIEGWQQVQQGDENKVGARPYQGQVRIVQFWTFSCHNCTATIPFLSGIYERWHDQGLEVVGVHSPEFDFEKNPAAVAEASKELGVTWPIALDPNKTAFFEWQGRVGSWPRTYVLDQQGQIRFNESGESAFDGDKLEEVVAYLIQNGNQPAPQAT